MTSAGWIEVRARVGRFPGCDLPCEVDAWSHVGAPGLVVTHDWDHAEDGTPVIGSTFSITHAESGHRLSTPSDPYRRAQFSTLSKAKVACLGFALCGDFDRSAEAIRADELLRHRANIVFDMLDTVPVSEGETRCTVPAEEGR